MCLLLHYLLAATAAAAATSCRDRRTWPFSSASIWNVPVGDGAVYNHANIYTLPPGPPPPKPANQCDAGKADPSTRSGCAGWRANWTSEDCLNHGCCYVDGPSPDPNGRVKCWGFTCNTRVRPAWYAWCYSNQTKGAGTYPHQFYVDTDYFIATQPTDPQTDFVDQGWWGQGDHCKVTGQVKGTIPFPHAWVGGLEGGNNAAAVLLPDNETLLQFQPLYRCEPGSPVLSMEWGFTQPWANVSILSDGIKGAHGGSHLSSIGGTVRLGELNSTAGPIRHALKLMLWAKEYYFPGNASVPCWRWPADHCDGTWNASRDPANPNYYNGTNPNLKPGALLAVPPPFAGAIAPLLRTHVGSKLLAALRDYGGYLDDNTASDSGAFNVEIGVADEVEEEYKAEGVSLRNAGQSTILFEDLVLIYQNLHIVQNNWPDHVGGGGIPLAPLAPPIC